jgi:hypothetical protein
MTLNGAKIITNEWYNGDVNAYIRDLTNSLMTLSKGTSPEVQKAYDKVKIELAMATELKIRG